MTEPSPDSTSTSTANAPWDLPLPHDASSNGIDLRPIATVRDGLYDRIPLAQPELALMQTPAFLRLDAIQQLGFVSRVWPGAKHTRYEHSLGVMHLTRLGIAQLAHDPAGAWITPEDIRTIVAAALLHDIGHYPFSHAIEELGPPVLTHEEVGSHLIQRGEIADVLECDWQVDPGRVADIIHADRDTLSKHDQILSGLLSGTLDMDKLDYLPRDARACSVPYGGVDTSRLLQSLTIMTLDDGASLDTGDQRTRIAIREKGISPLHSLINARQEMFDNVYWHHTNRACMIMLLRAIQDALVAGIITAESLTDHSDASLLAFMRRSGMPESTRTLADALANRRIHKRAVEVSSAASELYGRLGNLWFDSEARRNVELRLCDRLSELIEEPVPSTAVLIDIPKPERWKTDVWVTSDNPPIGRQRQMHWRDATGLEDTDMKRYEEARRLIRIVTEERYRHVMREHWAKLLYPLLGGAF